MAELEDNMEKNARQEKEADAISRMILKGAEHGLMHDVILSAMKALKNDPDISIEQACTEGIDEWIK